MKMKTRTKQPLQLVLLGAATISAAAAQNQPASPQQLPETVVKETKYSLTSPAIEVIREEKKKVLEKYNFFPTLENVILSKKL